MYYHDFRALQRFRERGLRQPAMTRNETPILSLKDIFWTFYLWPGFWLSRVLPASLMRDAGRWMAPFIVRLSPALRRMYQEETAGFPALAENPACPDVLFRACVTLACQRAADDLLMLRFPVEFVVEDAEVEGREHLEGALHLRRGIVLASGHFLGNRLAKRFMKSSGWPVLSVRNLAFEDPKLGRWGKRYLQRRYYDLLHHVIEDEIDVHDPECVLKILARLRRGGIVNIHIDAPFSRKLYDVSFLGTMRPFPVGFLEIARLAGSPIVPIVCLGNSRGLHIKFLPPLFPDTRPEREILEDLVRILEKQVLEHPEQWENSLHI